MNPLVLIYVILIFTNNVFTKAVTSGSSKSLMSYNELNDHKIVTNSEVFPYVAAVLKKSVYLSAGALIDENFVLTAADALFLPCSKMFNDKCEENDSKSGQVQPYPVRMLESTRVLRVRLGSINHKKGGILRPIKFYEIHPYFSDTKPEYDIALIKLAEPVRFTNNLNPIRLQRRPKEITATHFIVTAWPNPSEHSSDELQQLQSMEEIKRRRMLQVSHLHPTEYERCAEEMEGLDINATETLMCLDAALGADPCARDIGAPVVLNGILWGIMSSWRSEDCAVEGGPSFVTMVAANDIATWIHATLRGHRWTKHFKVVENDADDDDYDENDT